MGKQSQHQIEQAEKDVYKMPAMIFQFSPRKQSPWQASQETSIGIRDLLGKCDSLKKSNGRSKPGVTRKSLLFLYWVT